jgi:hypothetical protein
MLNHTSHSHRSSIFPGWSLIAIGYRIPTLAPTVCEFERTLTKCHLRRNLERSFRSKAHPKQPQSKSQPPLKQPPKPHIPQTLHPQPSTNLHAAIADSIEQSTAQVEVLIMNTSAPNTAPPPSHQHQTIETQEDLQQGLEKEIKAVIEDELARLHQENERPRLKQEHLAR